MNNQFNLFILTLLLIPTIESNLIQYNDYNIKVWQLYLPILIFIAFIKSNLKYSKAIRDKIFSSLVFLLILIVIGNHHTIDVSSSIKISLLFTLCIFWFIFLSIYLEKKNISQILLTLLICTLLISSTMIIQFFLALKGTIELPQRGDGFFYIGRPSAFFEESGWAASWIAFTVSIINILHKDFFPNKKIILSFNSICGLAIILSFSRIALAIFMLHFIFLVRDTKILKPFIYLFFTSLLFIFIFSIEELPDHFNYDVLDLTINPRLNDFKIIIDEVYRYERVLFGFGIGTLTYLNDIYPWRNFGANHNVFLLSIYYEYGIIGLIFIFALLTSLFIHIYKKSKIFIFPFLTILSLSFFHSALYRCSLWTCLSILLTLIQTSTTISNKNDLNN